MRARPRREARARSPSGRVPRPGKSSNRSWDPKQRALRRPPRRAPTVRAQCDAIEIADLLLGSAPPQLSAEPRSTRLASWQDAASGGVAPLASDGSQAGRPTPTDPDVAYHVLSVGYALDLLGARFPHPLSWSPRHPQRRFPAFCDGLPWANNAWTPGTGSTRWERRCTGASSAATRSRGVPETLFGWLLTHADPQTGMWGQPTTERACCRWSTACTARPGDLRAIRRSAALPRAGDRHRARSTRGTSASSRPSGEDACTVLDVAHPLWLTMATGYRAEEVAALAGGCWTMRWAPGRMAQGFGFHAPSPTARQPWPTGAGPTGHRDVARHDLVSRRPCGISEALGYRPRGMRRPEPANAIQLAVGRTER